MLDADAVQKIADLSGDHVGKVVPTGDGRQLVFVPEGFKIETVQPVNPVLPDHIRQSVRLDDGASFIAYVNTFKSEATRLFVDVNAARLTADLDYHKPASAQSQRAHLARYDMPRAEEWKRWNDIDGKSIPQAQFAEFLEENLDDIVDPAGAAVLEVATRLQAKKKVEFDSGIRLQDGAVQLTYREETDTGKGQMVIPSEIMLGIPVFFGGDRYKLKAFLRYRIEEGKLTFKIVIHRKAFIVQDAVREAAAAVATATELVALFGATAT